MTVYPARDGDAVRFPRCADCGTWHWPSAEVCRECGSRAVVSATWSGTAHVDSEVLVHRGVADTFLADGPFVLVKLDLGGFDFITRWLVRPADPRHGTPCALRWAEVDGRPWPLAVADDRL